MLGQSEGGLVALQAAQRSDGICGLILLANPAYAALLPDADRAIDTLTVGGRIDPTTLQAPLRPLFPSGVQGFLVSAFALDPAQLIRSAKLPVLILQGTRDLQVDMIDARRLATANPDAKLVELADVNHVLKQVASADRAANLATYLSDGFRIT